MTLFPTLRKALGGRGGSGGFGMDPEVKAVAGQYFDSLQRALSAQTGREWPIEKAVAEGYERLVWVFKPVDTIADHQAARRFVVRQGAEEVEDDPLARLMNKQANPLEDGMTFRKRLSAQALLSPRGVFVEVSKTRGGEPFRLDLLPPSRVTIIPGEEGADPRDTKSLVSHFELAPKDGIGKPKLLGPEQVRWIRNPHPLDPYRAVTPLSSATLSVELDWFTRLYNVMFLRNDGRPGGILGVKGDMDDDELDRIERKFGKGPVEAGKLSVITADGIQFVDPSAKPRDMNYMQLSRNAKIELLSAFGVAESVMGFSGDKTFANAEQELLAFWTLTMPPHLRLIAKGFDEDTDDAFENDFDLSDVEVLRKAQRDAELARAREEVKDGLRSPYSYAVLSGQTEVEDTIHTRSWYIASGKTPLPINQADADEMGLGKTSNVPGEGGEDEGGEPVVDPATAPGPGQEDVAAGGAGTGGSPEGAVPAGPGAGQAAAAASRAAAGPQQTDRGTGGAGAAALAAAAATAATQTKALPGVRLHVVGKADTPWYSDDADEDARDLLEEALQEALAELSEGWVERAIARVGSTKSRKHTRHWQPEGDRPVDGRVATKAIDPNYAVDAEQWDEQATEAVSPILVAAAVVAATATWSNLTGGGLHSVPRRVIDRASTAALEVAAFVGKAAARAGERLIRAINDADQRGDSMDDIVATIRDFGGRLRVSWSEGVSVQAATASTEQARGQAAQDVSDEPQPDIGWGRDQQRPEPGTAGGAEIVGGDADTTDGRKAPTVDVEVVQRWRSRRDSKVRSTHVQADGQQQPVGGLFVVGGFLLRFPGDPLAPAKETANCRCTVNYRSRRSGRFVARPNDPPMEAAQ